MCPLTEEVPLRHIDILVEVFQRLKDKGPLNPRSVWQYEKDQPWLKGYSYEELDQAFQDLVSVQPMALAKRSQQECFEVTDRGRATTKADLMYKMLSSYYEKNKDALVTYLRTRRNERIVGYIGLASIFIFGGLSFVGLGIYPWVPALGLAAIFVMMLSASNYFSARIWNKHHLSTEKGLAVHLLDAYSTYVPFVTKKEGGSLAETERIVKAAALRLEEGSQPTTWNTFQLVGEAISQTGREIRTRVLPILRNERRSASIGEILVRMARLLFEGSPESMKRASALFKDLPPPAVSVSVPLRQRFVRAVRTATPLRYSIAVTFSAIIVAIVAYIGVRVSSVPFEPNSVNLIAASVGVAAFAGFIERMLARLTAS